jgi:hypothetical protein
MIIPVHVNYPHFYSQAKKKGIKIQSRFKGVYAVVSRKKECLRWRAQVMIKGKTEYAYFPFTFDGEVEASIAYESMILNRAACQKN